MGTGTGGWRGQGNIPDAAGRFDTAEGAGRGARTIPAMANEQKKGFENTTKLSAGTVCAALAMGFVFGWSFEKSRVYTPLAIRAQFVFARWMMLKMFMGAVAGSVLCFLVLHAFFPERFEAMRSFFVKAPVDEACAIPVRKAGIGGAMLGGGMALAGACPGMVIVQAGAGTPNSWATLIGCVVGGVLYGYAEVPLERFVSGGPSLKPYVDKALNASYGVVAVCLLAVCAGVAGLLEGLVAWRSELDASHGVDTSGPICAGANVFACAAWPVSLCGVILGLLQLPSAFVATQALGTSSAYMTLTAGLLALDKREKGEREASYPRWSASVTGGYAWKVPFMGAAAAGALLSSHLGGTLAKAEGVHAAAAVVGGILMIFGAQLAAGCTSGHGLSGMGMLAASSFVAVPAMFGMGIVVGFVLDAAGAPVGR